MSNTVDGKILPDNKIPQLKEMLEEIKVDFLEGKVPKFDRIIADKSDMRYYIYVMLIAILQWFNDAPEMSLQEKKDSFKIFKPFESTEDNRLKFALDVTDPGTYSVQVLFQTNFGNPGNRIYRITFGIKNGNKYIYIFDNPFDHVDIVGIDEEEDANGNYIVKASEMTPNALATRIANRIRGQCDNCDELPPNFFKIAFLGKARLGPNWGNCEITNIQNLVYGILTGIVAANEINEKHRKFAVVSGGFSGSKAANWVAKEADEHKENADVAPERVNALRQISGEKWNEDLIKWRREGKEGEIAEGPVGITRLAYQKAKYNFKMPAGSIICEAGESDKHSNPSFELIYGKNWGDDTPALAHFSDAGVFCAPFGAWTDVEILNFVKIGKPACIYFDPCNYPKNSWQNQLFDTKVYNLYHDGDQYSINILQSQRKIVNFLLDAEDVKAKSREKIKNGGRRKRRKTRRKIRKHKKKHRRRKSTRKHKKKRKRRRRTRKR